MHRATHGRHADKAAEPCGTRCHITFWKWVALHIPVRELYSGLPVSSLGQLGVAGLWVPSCIVAFLFCVCQSQWLEFAFPAISRALQGFKITWPLTGVLLDASSVLLLALRSNFESLVALHSPGKPTGS